MTTDHSTSVRETQSYLHYYPDGTGKVFRDYALWCYHLYSTKPLRGQTIRLVRMSAAALRDFQGRKELPVA